MTAVRQTKPAAVSLVASEGCERAPTVVPGLIRDWLDRTNVDSRKPPIADQLKAWWGANCAEGGFATILKNAQLIPQILKYEDERRTARATKGYPHQRLFDLEPLAGPMPHARFDPKRVRVGRRWALHYAAMQGTFRIRLTATTSIFLISWGPSAKSISEMAIGTQKAFEILYERLETRRRRLQESAPAKGSWSMDETRADNLRRIWFFERRPLDVESCARFTSHPLYAPLQQDAGAFFTNIDWWTRYNQPGIRKVLLSGPPGTGKTSIALALAANSYRDLLVVEVPTSEALVVAVERAAAKRRRTIIIAEELDMLLRPSGEDLNWLDGSATPRNIAGTYLITTTNFPRRIDPRILKRPGRIDRILRVGALRTRDAATVASSFLGEEATALDRKLLGQALDRTTPAEIREIINLALRALMQGQQLTVDGIAQTRTALKQSLAIAADDADDDPETREQLHERFGPIDDVDPESCDPD